MLTIWWCPYVESFLCCWKKVFAMTSVFFWHNSISLCPASFCTPRPNLPVIPRVSWLLTFAFPYPIMKRTSFLMLVLEGLVGLHRTVQLQLLQHYWSGHGLGLLWCWMVYLWNEQRSFCHWDCTQILNFRLFVDDEGYSISSKGFLPRAVDIIVIWIKFAQPIHFSSLIPKMSLFTLSPAWQPPIHLHSWT